MTAPQGAPHIGLVVEGPGDKTALPLLLRQHLANRFEYADILGKPIPLKGKGSATVANGIEGYVLAAARPHCKGILVVVDADDDPSCQLGPDLLKRAQSVTDVPVVVVVAERDYEDWLYCSVETLDLGEVRWDPSARGKNALRSLLAPEKYVKSTMQAKLTSRIDLEHARTRSTSLDRLLRKFDHLVSVLL